jgi:molybdate transport system substrate-binding protein
VKSIILRYLHTYLIGGLGTVFALSMVSVSAEDLHIAVAANFTKPIKQLKQKFEGNSKHRVIISFGATGQLYAQIKHGAPFELFLAADMKRPKMLVDDGMAVAESLFTYAVGKLVLWNPQTLDLQANVLRLGKFNHLAIAHPKMAPYGTAAKQVLEELELWQALQAKIVRGNNVSQAYQFTATGNAELGFIALSQYKAIQGNSRGSYWLVPEQMYAPIQQGAVLLKKGQNKPLAKAFLAFLKSPLARQMIQELGYVVP